MGSTKTSTLTFRIEPALKEALRAADHEHRAIANMVEMLIRDYCGQKGVTIPGQGGLDSLQTLQIGRSQQNAISEKQAVLAVRVRPMLY